MTKRRCPARSTIRLGTLAALATMLLLLVPLTNAAERMHGDPGAGRQVLLAKGCLECHAILGKGNVFAPDLAKLGATQTFFQIAGLMWGHSPRMIESLQQRGLAWPQFTATEMEDMIAYLQSLGETREVGDSRRGELLFGELSCGRCHRVGGVGEAVGPPLDQLGRSPSGIHLAMAMWNHGQAMGVVMKLRGIERPQLGVADAAHLLAHIRAVSSDSRPIEYARLGDSSAGHEVFERVGCARCHGPMGRGDAAPALTASGSRGVAGIAAKLWNHAPEMMEEMRRAGLRVPTLDPDQTTDLMAFLGFLGYEDREPDIDAGRLHFEEKGCLQCHGHPGKADGLVADLGDVEVLESRSGAAAAMWNHAPSMAAAMEAEGSQMVWPRFVDDEMRDLVGYLVAARRAAGGESSEASEAATGPADTDPQ